MTFLDAIDQPTLLVDELIARANIQRMTEKAKQKGVQFRPHFKTHQSAQIGNWFRDYGISKITVSSVEMAEYFGSHGWDDITIAFSLNLRQVKRIHDLANQIHLEVLVENEEAILAVSQGLKKPLDVWLKVDVGNHRTGLEWEDNAEIERLCRKIKGASNLVLRGLLTHSGNTYGATSKLEVISIFREGIDRLNIIRNKLSGAGIGSLQISVGDTPGCSLCKDWSGVDEVRPGNFVFYDATQLTVKSCEFNDIAVALACPVIAKHTERNEVVVYGGAIHLSKDFLTVEGERTYGMVCMQNANRWGAILPGAVVRSLSQEHGVIRLAENDFRKINIGDLLFIIPAHSCLTVQVMGKYLTLEGKEISTLNCK